MNQRGTYTLHERVQILAGPAFRLEVIYESRDQFSDIRLEETSYPNQKRKPK